MKNDGCETAVKGKTRFWLDFWVPVGPQNGLKSGPIVAHGRHFCAFHDRSASASLSRSILRPWVQGGAGRCRGRCRGGAGQVQGGHGLQEAWLKSCCCKDSNRKVYQDPTRFGKHSGRILQDCCWKKHQQNSATKLAEKLERRHCRFQIANFLLGKNSRNSICTNSLLRMQIPYCA